MMIGFFLVPQLAQAEPTKENATKLVAADGKKPADKPVQDNRGLTFKNNYIAVKAAPDAKKVTVPFYFENKTNRTIKIARYDSACSCLSAKVKGGKLTYQPGEKGEMKVDFALGSFSGLVEKTVLLWTTDDVEQRPSSVLTVALTIPVLFEVTPKTMFWEQNGSKTPKSFKLKVNNDQPIRIVEHSSTNANFPYQLKTIRDGWEYELVVTPTDVTVPAFGMIRLKTDASISRYQRQMAFVCVRKAVATPPAKQP
ncbi:MAG: DUF1573 domain-containing protein [Verrucomicrobiae bacterium]|nr:DUF1573 domain-containing protein [Verrucomicrobiae bacterium]NNJ86058.1 DUF1573 domain-containing protein [Akkermansiaceae bacterium]